MSVSKELQLFLGHRATGVVDDITDAEVRQRVIGALEVCAESLVAVDGLDLEQYEMSDIGSQDLSMWNAVAPDVSNMLKSVQAAIDRLGELFPATAGTPEPDLDVDLDSAFDFEDAETSLTPTRDNRHVQIDEVVEAVTTANAGEQVGAAIAALAGMLGSDFVNFGKRLRNPRVVADRWFLLGELQEFRSKCSRCLEAVAASVLNAFSNESLEELLPRYRTDARRAARLRSCIVDIASDVAYYAELFEVGVEDHVAELSRALARRLDKLAETIEYRHLRAQDKREFIVFRLQLRDWTPQSSTLQELRQAAKGFSTFLEVMRGINRRAGLISQDRGHLQAAQQVLDSTMDTEAAMPHLLAVYGRSEELDRWLRAHKQGLAPSIAELPELISDALAAVQSTA